MKDPKKKNYIVLEGAKPFRGQKDNQISLTLKQAAAFSDKLQLTEDQEKELADSRALRGLLPSVVASVKPAKPKATDIPSEGKSEGEGAGENGDDKAPPAGDTNPTGDSSQKPSGPPL